MPAQNPKTGIPAATRVCTGSGRPKISASFQIGGGLAAGVTSPAGGGMCHRQALGCASPGA